MATTTICGKTIQIDRSGVGHCWRTIDASEMYADIREEVAAEIIDAVQDHCESYLATNGLCYRW